MAKRIKKIDINDYVKIAQQYHEEYPVYECKKCFRETIYGKETMKHGEICAVLFDYTCIYCNSPLIKLTFE